MKVKKLVGYGDTVKVGDLIRMTFIDEITRKRYSDEEVVLITDFGLRKTKPRINWETSNPNKMGECHYTGVGWHREFRIASEEEAKKFWKARRRAEKRNVRKHKTTAEKAP